MIFSASLLFDPAHLILYCLLLDLILSIQTTFPMQDTYRLSKVMADPINGLTDMAFDVGGDLLLKRIGLKGAPAAAPETRPIGGSVTAAVGNADCSCSSTAREADMSSEGGAISGAAETSHASAASSLAWTKLRGAVLGISSFRDTLSSGSARRRARDDSCVSCRSSGTASSGATEVADAAAAGYGLGASQGKPDAPPLPWASIGPQHRAALSMMLSMMIGGLSSGVLPSHAVGVSPTDIAAASAFATSHATVSAVVSEAASDAIGGTGIFKAADGATIMLNASLRAPSLVSQISSGPVAENLVGAGGMAMSTALRMLRAGKMEWKNPLRFSP